MKRGLVGNIRSFICLFQINLSTRLFMIEGAGASQYCVTIKDGCQLAIDQVVERSRVAAENPARPN